MRNFNTAPTALSVLTENLCNNYTNEYLLKEDFRKLQGEDYKLAMMEYALSEYVNTSKIIDVLFDGKDGKDSVFADVEVSLKGNAYFNDIGRSAGDITRTKHHKDVISLLQYSEHANQSSSYKSDGTVAFEQANYDIMKCISHFVKNAGRFKTIIAKEATNMNSKRIGTAFYKMAVFLVQTTADILYSNSLKAEFDYNVKVPVANNVYFEYTNGVVDEMLTFIRYLNGAFLNGKIFTAIEETLQESFNAATSRIELNEGVIDTVFGLVTHFKTLDLLFLWPMYLTRAVAYWVGYFYVSLKNISLDIESSLQIQKAQSLNKDQYDKYAHNAQVRGLKAQQAFAKANVTIDMGAKEDRKALQNLQGSQGGVLI